VLADPIRKLNDIPFERTVPLIADRFVSFDGKPGVKGDAVETSGEKLFDG
jgi:hypothetical protein